MLSKNSKKYFSRPKKIRKTSYEKVNQKSNFEIQLILKNYLMMLFPYIMHNKSHIIKINLLNKIL